jgi:hypothetical protein
MNRIITRQEYNTEMRKAFSNRMCINEDGSINHRYFQSKVGQFWTEKDDKNLILGINEFGVNSNEEIKQKFLKNWVKIILTIGLKFCLKIFILFF